MFGCLLDWHKFSEFPYHLTGNTPLLHNAFMPALLPPPRTLCFMQTGKIQKINKGNPID